MPPLIKTNTNKHVQPVHTQKGRTQTGRVQEGRTKEGRAQLLPAPPRKGPMQLRLERFQEAIRPSEEEWRQALRRVSHTLQADEQVTCEVTEAVAIIRTLKINTHTHTHPY